MNEKSKQTSRKPYRKPQLARLGDIRELTRGGAGGPGDGTVTLSA